MFDAAHSLETVVVDDPDAPPARPIRSRTSTDGALTMHVHVDGRWHRRTPDLKTTACGKPYHSELSRLRREELCQAAVMCPDGCFTKHELRLATTADAKPYQGDRR